jgi:hypothetical protein
VAGGGFECRVSRVEGKSLARVFSSLFFWHVFSRFHLRLNRFMELVNIPIISSPVPFFAVLLFWLTITFASFGLFAPRNAMVVTVLFVCALSVGSAVFLVLEMDGPFDGLLKVSADPLRYAHAHLNQ